MRKYLVTKICGVVSSLALAFSASSAFAYPAGASNGSFFLGNSGLFTINAGASVDNLVYGGAASCKLVMQSDGDLVLTNLADNSVIWSTGTKGNPGAYTVIQNNALVVLGSAGKPLWSSPTFKSSDTDFLGLDGSCDLRIYDSAMVTAHDFHTNTVAETQIYGGTTLAAGQALEDAYHQYKLLMQSDGNLVLSKIAGNVLLAQSGTGGNPGAFATMQSDGNFVIYSSAGKALVSTNTGGHPYGYFFLELSGTSPYLNIYSSTGFNIWQLPAALLVH